jgi:ubiquinone biosynthesis protein COQ4
MSNVSKLVNIYKILRGIQRIKRGAFMNEPATTVNGAFDINNAMMSFGAAEQMVERFLENGGAEVLRERHNLDGKLTRVGLSKYTKPGTLGNELLLMYEAGLNPEFYNEYVKTKPVTEVEYLTYRVSQHHDILHIVTGYPTTGQGELGIFTFIACQNLDQGAFVIAAGACFSLLTRLPHEFAHVMRILEYSLRISRTSKQLLQARFDELLDADLGDIRGRFGLPRAGVWEELNIPEKSLHGVAAPDPLLPTALGSAVRDVTALPWEERLPRSTVGMTEARPVPEHSDTTASSASDHVTDHR